MQYHEYMGSLNLGFTYNRTSTSPSSNSHVVICLIFLGLGTLINGSIFVYLLLICNKDDFSIAVEVNDHS